jgi:chromosome segregation ATPase
VSKRKPEKAPSSLQHEVAYLRKEVDRLTKENAYLRNGVQHVLRAAGETEPSGEDWASRIFNAFKRLKQDLVMLEAARESWDQDRRLAEDLQRDHEKALADNEHLREANECLQSELCQTFGVITAYVDSQGGQVEIPLVALVRSGPGWVLTVEDDWRGMVRIIRVRKPGEGQ